MRKLMISAGLAFSVTGVAFAGERSRGTSGDSLAGGTADALTPVMQEIAPGVVKMSVGAIETLATANNVVRLSDILREHGSVERFTFNSAVTGKSSKSSNGAMVFANGAVGFFYGLLGSNSPVQPPARTQEEFKSQMQYAETTSGVLVFANGAVFNGQETSESQYALHIANGPSAQNGSSAIFADNTSFYGH